MSASGTSMLSAQISAIKGHKLSSDKRELSLLLDAKHVGELAIILSTEQLEQLALIISQVKAELPVNSEVQDQLKVNVPKNYLVAADLKVHDLVLLVFNRQTAAQAAYALDPAAAKKIAEGLVKNADLVLRKKQGVKTKDDPPRSKH